MIGNVIQSVLQPLVQNEMGKNNAEWQWNRFYSPKAQVSNLAEVGINPAVAFGNQSPVMTTGGQMTMPDVPALGIGTTALSEIGNYLNAKANAEKANVETKGTELDNIVKAKTQEDRIKEVAIRNKFNEEQTTKVINEWQKLVGEVNILQTEGEIKKIDLQKHSKLVDGLIDSYISKANLDNAQADALRQQLPILLEKLQKETEVLSVDAEIAQDYKETMTRLGIVGDAFKIIGQLVKIFK